MTLSYNAMVFKKKYVNLKKEPELLIIVDTFYFLIKLYKKVCVSRLRKKRFKVQKNRDDEKYKNKIDIDLQIRP